MWLFKKKEKSGMEIPKKFTPKDVEKFPTSIGFIKHGGNETLDQWRLNYNQVFDIYLTKSTVRTYNWYHVLLTFKINVTPNNYIINNSPIIQKLIQLGFDRADISKNYNEIDIRCGIVDMAIIGQVQSLFKLVNEVETIYNLLFDNIKMPENKTLVDSTNLPDYFLAMEEEFNLGIDISDHIFFKVVTITKVKDKFQIISSIQRVYNIIEDDITNMDIETSDSTIKVSIYPKLRSLPTV